MSEPFDLPDFAGNFQYKILISNFIQIIILKAIKFYCYTFLRSKTVSITLTESMKTKNLLILSVVSFALFIIVTSCSKNSDSGASAQLSATLSGTAYQPSQLYAIDEYGNIDIMGLQVKSGDSISLSVSIPDTATGKTALTLDDAAVDYYDTKGNIAYSSWYYPSHGTVTFTSWDKSAKKIAGSFSGVIYRGGATLDSVVVTNGKFNTTYQLY
jgi:hypothetical protein